MLARAMREHAARLARLAQVPLHVAGVAAPPPRAALTGEAIDAIGACASMLTRRRTALVHVGSTRAPAISRLAAASEGVDTLRALCTVGAWFGGTLIDVGAARVATIPLSARAKEAGRAIFAGALVLTRRRRALLGTTKHTRRPESEKT